MDILIFLLSLIFFIFLPLGQLFRISIGNGLSVIGLDIAVCLTSIIWVFMQIRKRGETPPLFLPVMLFVFVGVLSLLVNLTWLKGADLFVSFLYLFRWFCYASLIWIIWDVAKKSKSFVNNLLLIGGGIVMVLGMLQYIFFPSLHKYLYLGWDDHFYRVFSTFLDPNFVGAFLVLYLFLVFAQLIRNRSKKNIKTYLILINLVTLTAIFLTYSRSAYLMLGVGIIIFLWNLGYKKLIIAAVLCLGAVVIILGIYHRYGEGNNLLRTVSISSRLGSMQTALTIFTKEPILGVGFNSYRYAQRKYGFLQGNIWETTHAGAGTSNSYLFILATVGIVGFVTYIFFLFKIFQKTSLLEKKEKLLGILLKTSLISLLVNALFENTLFYPSIMLWIFCLVGLILSDH